MTDAAYDFVSIDLMPLLAATLAALTCGLLGNFLVLRRQSLMGDAISHSVLPGLVIAFLLTGAREPTTMLLGAALSGVATVVIIEFIKRFGRVEPGAAMGVTFSILFALGVLLLERAAASQVDLDAECVLHGQLETLFWFPERDWGALLSLSTLGQTPRQVVTLLVAALVAAAFVTVFFKELRIASFDPGLATSVGVNATAMHYALMILVAAATVASFEAVGSILVIAMLICPAATARLLTDRLASQIAVSAIVAVLTGVGGYALGAWAPTALGAPASVNAAGSMTVVAGLLLTGAVIASPSHGVLARLVRRRRLANRVLREDLLGALHRAEESGVRPATIDRLATVLGSRERALHALRLASDAGHARRRNGAVELTDDGRREAADLVRRHRLWETYLVDRAGIRPDHAHDPAETLEHVRGPKKESVAPPRTSDTDPHGREIPRA